MCGSSFLEKYLGEKDNKTVVIMLELNVLETIEKTPVFF